MTANAEQLLGKLRHFMVADDTGQLLPLPLPKLQSKYGGYRRTTLTILAGYPSDGKTQFAMQFAESALNDGLRVCIFSLEMDQLEVAQALMTQGGVHPDVVQKRREPTDLERRAMKRRAAWMKDVGDRLRVVDHLYRLEDMEEYLDGAPPFDLVIVDHLHQMDYGEQRDLEKTAIGFKKMAKAREQAVLLLCQLTPKRGENGGYPVPDNTQLRGTAMIEGTANHILYVWRERDGNGQRGNNGVVAIGKWRNGQTDWAFDVNLHIPDLRFYEGRHEDAPARDSRKAQRSVDVPLPGLSREA